MKVYHVASNLLRMTCLAFIMFHVGLEFEVEKAKGCAYVTVDILVSVASAFLAWGLCVAWFIIALPFSPCYGFQDKLKDSVLTAHFSASTSAGVLFSMVSSSTYFHACKPASRFPQPPACVAAVTTNMHPDSLFALMQLAAANLSSSWTYRKARVLAIFDDLATIISIIPVKVLYIGLEWSMAVQFSLMAACLILAFAGTHKLPIPYIWPAVLGYAAFLAITSESVYVLSVEVLHKYNFSDIHIEVMLPAFAIGCAAKVSHGAHSHSEPSKEGDSQEGDKITSPTKDTILDAAATGAVVPEAVANASILNKGNQPKKKKEACLTAKAESTVHLVLSAIFMVFVGLSMPGFGSASPHDDNVNSADYHANSTNLTTVGVEQEDCTDPTLTAGETVFHVTMVTLLQNFGKMLPMVFYTKESSWRERLALSLSMCPRGEVGAAILVIATTLGVTGPIVVVSALSLALNLALTGVFITVVKVLLEAERKRKTHTGKSVETRIAHVRRNRAMSGHFVGARARLPVEHSNSVILEAKHQGLFSK